MTDEASTGVLRIERRDDGVTLLTKVNAEANFGMTLAMLSAMTEALEAAREDDAVRAIVIDAAGNGFHAGAVAITELKPSLTDLSRADFERLVEMGHALGRRIADLPVPVIGIARGGALGGGLELLLRSDFLYCLDSARFSFPEVTLGFVAAWGGTQLTPRLMPFRKAQEFLLLGEAIDGRAAEAYGLVTRSFADEAALRSHVEEVLDRLRLCSPHSLRWTKQCLQSVWEGPLAHGERVEILAEAETMVTGDFHKGLAALLAGAKHDYVSDTQRKKTGA
jgi:enoyl-CoA hydratase/carnithine racemase